MSTSPVRDAARVPDRRPYPAGRTPALPSLFADPFRPANPPSEPEPVGPQGRTFVEVRRLDPDSPGLDEIETIWQIFLLGTLETEVLQHADGWASCPCAQYTKSWTCDHINLLVYLGLIVTCDFVSLASDPTEAA